MGVIPKYYYYNERQGFWIVQKRIGSNLIMFGTYKSEKEAALAVELFNQYGWNKKYIWRVKAEVKEMNKEGKL